MHLRPPISTSMTADDIIKVIEDEQQHFDPHLSAEQLMILSLAKLFKNREDDFEWLVQRHPRLENARTRKS